MADQKERIIVYGAGKWGKHYGRRLCEDYTILCWVDKNFERIKEMNGYQIESPAKIADYQSSDYDKIVICIQRKYRIIEDIEDELHTQYGIQSEKIVRCDDIIRQERISSHRAILDILGNNVRNSLALSGGGQKLKIRVFFQEYGHAWNALRSLCVALEEDQQVELVIILCSSNNEAKMAIVKKDIHRVIFDKDYDIIMDSPDIVITSPFAGNDKSFNKMLWENANYVCQLPFGLLKTEYDITAHIRRLTENLNGETAGCSIVDKLIYDEALKEDLADKGLVCIGNPKFDEIYRALNDNIPYPVEWEKIREKRKILWTTDHGWLSGNVTFDNYFTEIFCYFEKNKDLGLIFRPHPRLMMELEEDGIWTAAERKYFKEAINNSDNMVYDDYTDYSRAYKFSDAVITDVNCGIIVSALPLGKPLGVLYRQDLPDLPLYPELVEKLYQMRNTKELFDFFEMVRIGEDFRKSDRENACKQYIAHFDGQNGRRIKEYLLKDYKQKCGFEG